MTVLVDEARWPWRGTHWCHLISDGSLAELHAFAALLGCRRVGFQGDHYDIDIETRAHALELGAQPATSREVVHRLRAAGLRLRPSSFPKWQLERRWDSWPGSDARSVDEMIVSAPSLSPGQHALLRDIARVDGDGAFALRRNGAVAAVVHGSSTAPPVPERPDDGVHARIDAGGRWSVELIHPPLDDSE